MARHRTYVSTAATWARSLDQQARAKQRAAERMRAQAEREARQRERAARIAYLQDRSQQADALNADLERQLADLDSIVRDAIGESSWRFDLASLRKGLTLPEFDPQGNDVALDAPSLEEFLPAHNFLARLLLGSKRIEAERLHAEEELELALKEHKEIEQSRTQKVAELRTQYDEVCQRLREEDQAEQARLDKLEQEYRGGIPEAVVTYFALVLDQFDPLPD